MTAGREPGPDIHLDRAEQERWSAEAELQLRGARRDLAAGDHSLAAFRAEQSAQMSLKGLLRGIGQPGWGHDLVRLGNTVRELFGPELAPAQLDEALKRLSVHYITSRYPDAFSEGTPSAHYSHGIAEAALADAGEVSAAVGRIWDALLSGRHG